MRNETIEYTCDLTGRATLAVADVDADEDEGYDLPVGWARIRVEVAVPNPEAELFAQRLRATAEQQLAQAEAQGAEISEEDKPRALAELERMLAGQLGNEPPAHRLVLVEGHLSPDYVLAMDNETWCELLSPINAARKLTGLAPNDDSDGEGSDDEEAGDE